MKVTAIIPTKTKTPQFDSIINTLDISQVDDVVVFNNGDRKLNATWYEIRNAEGYSIYQMWNEGLNLSDNRGSHALILNDDIEFKPWMVSFLSAYLDRDNSLGIVFPDYDAQEDTGSYNLRYTETTAGDGGMSGFCFMIRKNLHLRVDESLKLYWGDDDLVKQTIAAGYKVARVVGLPVSHEGSYTINQMDRHVRQVLMEADRIYFNQKYGENREPPL